ncbi:MAG: S41 family peptidase [Lachnospiraceae bacterium]|nr:S41 family peptidase [Lachnospiraceae bacterium]
MQETNEIQQQELLKEIEGRRKEQAKSKRLYFMGGVIAGLLVALLISCVVYLVQMKNSRDVSVLGAKATQTDAAESAINALSLQKLGIIEDSINEYYLGEITKEDLETGLYRGILEATGDPYSEYYTPEELEELQESSSGIYYGIGAYIGLDPKTQYCKISGVIEGTPAEESGLMAEDLIVKVDGQDTFGMETTEVVKLVKGEENTDVVLTIARTGEKDYLEITVTRRRVEAPTVNYEMLDDGIAHIEIMQFEEVTGDQFEEKLAKAREDGMKSLVLDLRGNPGGTLQSVVEVARALLPEGLIVYMEDKKGKRVEYACDGKNQLDVPLVVLINENSASAAEILAGAIKDYEIGTLVGTTTFGKGIVQKVFGITDGSGMKLTISHYYTPKGNDIHKVGVTPDEELELDVEKYVKDGSDNQLDRAIEILSGEK